MNEYLIQKETLDDIASAIQEKAAPTEDFTVADFGNLIRRIEIPENNTTQEEFYQQLWTATLTEITEQNLSSFPSRIYKKGLFMGCKSLEKVTIPSHIAVLPERAFQECSKLYEVNFLSDNTLTSLGPFTFCECTNLTTIQLPQSIKSIGGNAFQYSSITNINLENIEQIYTTAFQKCVNLQEVNLSSVNRFGGVEAFDDCSSLTKVILPDIPPTISAINHFPTTNPGFKFHVSSAEVEAAYLAATNWSTYNSNLFTYPGKEEA